MSRPSLDARRFYADFYRWTLLTSPSPSHRSCNHAVRRALSASPHQRQRQDGAPSDPIVRSHPSRVIIRKHRASTPDAITGHHPKPLQSQPQQHAQATAQPPPTDPGPTKWRIAPVQKSVEKPFTALRPWKEAIRYRSATGLMLEVAVPEDRARAMARQFGEGLQRLNERTGAKSELGSRIETVDGGVGVRSLLVSGTFEECSRVMKTLRNFRSDKNYETWLATQRRLDEAKRAKFQPSHPEFSAKPPQSSTPKTATAAIVRTASEAPSSTLRPWEFVARTQDEDTLTLELTVTEDRAQGLQALYGPHLEDLTHGRYTGIQITLAPAHDNLEHGFLYSVLITGPPTTTASVKKVLQTLRSDSLFRERMFQHETRQRLSLAYHTAHFAKVDVRSHLTLPVEKIESGGFALRSRSPNGQMGSVEMVIAETTWRVVLAKGGVARLRDRVPGVRGVEVGEVQMKEGRAVRYLVVEGQLGAVGMVRQLIGSLAGVGLRSGVDGRGLEDGGGGDGAVRAEAGAGGEVASVDDYFEALSAEELGSEELLDADGVDNVAPVETAAGTNFGVSEEYSAPASRAKLGSGEELGTNGAESGKPAAKFDISGPSEKDPVLPLQQQVGQADETEGTASPGDFSAVAESPSRLRVPLPASMRRYLTGLRGRTHLRILRQSGASRLDYASRDPEEPCADVAYALVEGEPQPLKEAERLIREIVRFAQVMRPRLAETARFLEGKTEWRAPPKKWCAMVRIMPGATEERRREVAGSVWGAHGDEMHRLTMRTCAFVTRVEGEEGVFVVKGYEEGDMEAVVEGLGKLIREKENMRDGEGMEVVERWVKVGTKEGGWAREGQEGFGGLSSADASQRHSPATDPRALALSDEVRAASRPLTHPVVLITSRVAGPTGKTAEQGETYHQRLKHCRGVTVSSFTTLSLHPTPVVTFNLKVPSRTWDAIEESGRLCVHVMAATPEAAAITHAFTLPHSEPESPFRSLIEMDGVGVFVRGEGRVRAPPRIQSKRGAVLARMDAQVLRKKCVVVGDHIVVVAEVRGVYLPGVAEEDGGRATRLEGLDGAAGLAYGRRKYRSLGEEIEVPETLELGEKEGARAGVVEGEQREMARDTELSEEDDADGFASQEMQDGAREDSAATRAVYDGESEDSETRTARLNDVSEASSELDRARRTAAMDEEDEYDFRFGAEDRQQLGEELDGILDHASQSTRPPSSANRPGPPFMRRPAQQISQYGYSRAYSAGVTRPEKAGSSDPEQHVTDSSLLSETVGDFLGETGEFKSRGRMRALLKAKETAERAAREISRALADGSLTEERSLQLERTIAVNERRVAKKLALRAADELRRMLDTGKVDVSRSQWLESAVEKGMVVCVEEARRARAAFDHGKIDEGQFGLVSERLGREHGMLNQEAMRLRGMWDEEEEGCVGAPEREREEEVRPERRGWRGGFDGFGVNV